jgi:hypothetical protein
MMQDPLRDAAVQGHPSERRGIGFGLFLVLAGGVLLAERVGWLPASTDWLLPTILIAWGASELYARFSK